ncbi:hypothetical protein [Pantoea sp. 18069]|uniref:hypothetical protein n=1 Tax=Pantoea sp. 18069 TaxID=2681415 RepID=UPI00135AD68B|nr:hypothetical protein [Pantoea sp. 18069]
MGNDQYDTRTRSGTQRSSLIGRVPFEHWHTNTFVCALRQTGLTAPCVLDGPTNGNSFRAWVEQMLAPQLVRGDIVVNGDLKLIQISSCQRFKTDTPPLLNTVRIQPISAASLLLIIPA